MTSPDAKETRVIRWECPECGSLEVAFRRGDWLQCEDCKFGEASKHFRINAKTEMEK